MSHGRAPNASVDEIEQHLRAAAELIAIRASAPLAGNAEVIARLDHILTTLGAAAEYPVNWVKLEKYVELTGDSADSVQARRRMGKWLDGMQCKIVDGRLWIDLRAAQRWVAEWDGLAPSLALRESTRRPSKANR